MPDPDPPENIKGSDLFHMFFLHQCPKCKARLETKTETFSTGGVTTVYYCQACKKEKTDAKS